MSGLSAYWLIFHSESDTYVVSSLHIQRCPIGAVMVQGLSVSVAKKSVLAMHVHGTTKPLLPFGRSNAIPFL